jgi:hypothetical protein
LSDQPDLLDAKAGERAHDRLVRVGEKWLRRQNCGVVLRQDFRTFVETGEQPDVIGWRNTISILVECKASRADFLADKRKPFRADPSKGLGDWRFYLCAEGLISVRELPAGWGLLHERNGRVKAVAGVPDHIGWAGERPFASNKVRELQMLYSALRRVEIRGHFDDIYAEFGKPAC